VSRFHRIVALLMLVLTTGLFAADGESPLIEAVKRGDHNAVRTLLRGKTNVNAASVDGTTALHYAVQSDDIELVRMLLQAGANAKATNRYKY
jgi:hypothetical protein